MHKNLLWFLATKYLGNRNIKIIGKILKIVLHSRSVLSNTKGKTITEKVARMYLNTQNYEQKKHNGCDVLK